MKEYRNTTAFWDGVACAPQPDKPEGDWELNDQWTDRALEKWVWTWEREIAPTAGDDQPLIIGVIGGDGEHVHTFKRGTLGAWSCDCGVKPDHDLRATLDSFERRYDSHERVLIGQIDSAPPAVPAPTTKLHTRFERLRDEFARVEHTQGQIYDELNELQGKVKALDEGTNGLTSRVADMERRDPQELINTHGISLHELYRRVAAIEERLSEWADQARKPAEEEARPVALGLSCDRAPHVHEFNRDEDGEWRCDGCKHVPSGDLLAELEKCEEDPLAVHRLDEPVAYTGTATNRLGGLEVCFGFADETGCVHRFAREAGGVWRCRKCRTVAVGEFEQALEYIYDAVTEPEVPGLFCKHCRRPEGDHRCGDSRCPGEGKDPEFPQGSTAYHAYWRQRDTTFEATTDTA